MLDAANAAENGRAAAFVAMGVAGHGHSAIRRFVDDRFDLGEGHRLFTGIRIGKTRALGRSDLDPINAALQVGSGNATVSVGALYTDHKSERLGSLMNIASEGWLRT